MPLRLDTKTAIVAMIENPSVFPTVATALDKDITKHLAGHFKDKGMGIGRLRATHGALGGESLTLAFEALDDKAIAALVKKVDPHWTAGAPSAVLAHLADLAAGEVEPQPKPEKPRKAPTPTTRAHALTRAGADKAASAKGTGTRPTGSAGTGVPSPSKAGTPAKRRSKTAPSKGD